MGKILALDYGTKRVGLAITDDLQMIASPLETIHSATLIDYLKKLTSTDKIDAVVLGMPKGLKGEETNATRAVENLQKELKRKFPQLEIHLYDERFTSAMASMTLIQGGMKKSKRQEKGALDKVSAAIILQSFLDHRSTTNQKSP